MSTSTTAPATVTSDDDPDGGAYVRSYYRVPARVGGHVRYQGTRIGQITAFDGSRIMVRYGDDQPVPHHPTWQIEYVLLDPPTPPGDHYTRISHDRLLVAPGGHPPPHARWAPVGERSDGAGVYAPRTLTIHVIWPRQDRDDRERILNELTRAWAVGAQEPGSDGIPQWMHLAADRLAAWVRRQRRPRTRTLTTLDADLINLVRRAVYHHVTCSPGDGIERIIGILGPGLWYPAAERLLIREQNVIAGETVNLTDTGDATIIPPTPGSATP